MAGLSLYITVGKTKQIVTGLHQDTTVENVVQWLCGRNGLTGRYLLVEEWRGCKRPMNSKEKLSDSFLSWGSETRHVTLKLVNYNIFKKYRCNSKKGRWLERKRKFDKRFHNTKTGASRVCSKHYPRTGNHYRFNKVHRNLLTRRLQDSVLELIELLKKLQVKDNGEDFSRQNTGTTTLRRTEAEMVSFLNPYLQGEYISSKRNVSKARQMKKELEKHKKELEQNLNNRQSEILSLETNIEGTQEKVRHDNNDNNKKVNIMCTRELIKAAKIA